MQPAAIAQSESDFEENPQICSLRKALWQARVKAAQHRSHGDFHSALIASKEHAAIAQQLIDVGAVRNGRNGFAGALLGQAMANIELGDFQQADECCAKATALRTGLVGRGGNTTISQRQAHGLLLWGDLHRDKLADKSRAKRLYRRSCELYVAASAKGEKLLSAEHFVEAVLRYVELLDSENDHCEVLRICDLALETLDSQREFANKESERNALANSAQKVGQHRRKSAGATSAILSTSAKLPVIGLTLAAFLTSFLCMSLLFFPPFLSALGVAGISCLALLTQSVCWLIRSRIPTEQTLSGSIAEIFCANLGLLPHVVLAVNASVAGLTGSLSFSVAFLIVVYTFGLLWFARRLSSRVRYYVFGSTLGSKLHANWIIQAERSQIRADALASWLVTRLPAFAKLLVESTDSGDAHRPYANEFVTSIVAATSTVVETISPILYCSASLQDSASRSSSLLQRRSQSAALTPRIGHRRWMPMLARISTSAEDGSAHVLALSA